MKRHLCPRCQGARRILDYDRRDGSQRRVCPLCGESEWLNFDLRRPNREEQDERYGLTHHQSTSRVMRELSASR